MKNLFKIILFVTFFMLPVKNSLLANDVHFIDYSKVMNESVAGKKAQDYLKKLLNNSNKKFNETAKKIKSEENKIISQKNVLSKEEYNNKANALRKKVFNLNKEREKSIKEVASKRKKAGDEIDCVITEIDKEKRRVAISHRLTTGNPFEIFESKYPVGSEVEGEIASKNEYSIFLKIDSLDIDAFLHCNDLTYLNNGEEELTKHKIGDKLKVKVLEVKAAEQKIRVGLRQTQPDPFDWFKDKKVKQAITVKIISTDNKGLVVRPEGCEMDFVIKKSAIAINVADARPARFTGGERIDCAIAELDLDKRKATLSIKLLEEIERKDALEKYGSEGSGKNLPFSSLSDDLKKKKKEDE